MKRYEGAHPNNTMPRGGARALVAFAAATILLWAGPGRSQERRVAIVYTNSLNGNLDYCQCKNDPRGGLVKRATEIKRIRDRYRNVVLFETGDFFTYEPDPLLNRYVIRAYALIGYSAVLFGDQELAGGVEGFLPFKDSLPFLCNNILLNTDRGWKNPFRRSLVIDAAGLKIGVTGSVSGTAFSYYPERITKNIRLLDQADETRKEVASLSRGGAELIVLLSHSGYDEDLELAKKLDGVDVIVGGHSQTLLKDPVKKGDTLIVQAGANGAHIGILELSVSGGKIISFTNSFRLPDEFQPEDNPAIRRLIDEYRREVEKTFNKVHFK